MNKNVVVAIDGYSSCGKSTLAKALAKKLNYIYVDSGAMYRAVTLFFLRNNIDLHEHGEISTALQKIELNFHSRDYNSHISLNGEDVSEEIRQMPVSENVSKVAAIKEVRLFLVKQQQKMGASKNIIMDGRDIGTTVFPNAQVKLFMTADPEIRAQRRYNELVAKGEKVSLEEIIKNLSQRDLIDTTREESPLTKANDAIVLDNSYLSEEDQLNFALNTIASFIKAA